MPCASCAGKLIQAGITEVFAPTSDNPRWQADFKLVEQMFWESGVRLITVNITAE
jgi:deoxycytidylate deaminase